MEILIFGRFHARQGCAGWVDVVRTRVLGAADTAADANIG